MRRAAFIAGAALGYVMGARAGRDRYEQIAKAARDFAQNPAVRAAAANVRDQAGVYGAKAAHLAGEAAHDGWAKTEELRQRVNERRHREEDGKLVTM
ncbi:hypothetical protein GCM10027589_09270 [Actinocorallia lasiicapitis]